MRSGVTAGSTFPLRRGLARPVVALLRRDFQIRRSYRVAFALDLFFGFLNLLIYFFISRTFLDAGTADLGAAPSYFAFAFVGIVLTVVVQAAASEAGAVLRQEQLTGTLEALVIQPVTSVHIALGLAALPFAYAVARVAFYLVIAALWLDVDVGRASWLGFVAVLAATGVAMLSVGIGSCAVVLLVKRGELLVGMVLLAMGLLGGAFFPISVLPAWLEAIGRVVPTRFAFDGARDAIFSGAGWGEDVAFLLLFSVVVLPISLLFFRQALAVARRTGSLGQY
jgi:ABC-2 type transport system permease protein